MNLGFFKNLKTGSLKVKILFPLIVYTFFCVAGIILFARYFYTKHLLNNAITRGQQLAHSLGTCIQIVHYPYELQRIVYAFASEKHVHFIAILGGTPLRVLACNRNALKNKPWQHRNLPEGIRLPNFPQEQDACFSFLEAQINILKPKMILCMGKISSNKMLNQKAPIGTLRGQFFEYNNIPLMVTYHPSALLRNEQLKRPAWDDLKMFKAKLDEIKQK